MRQGNFVPLLDAAAGVANSRPAQHQNGMRRIALAGYWTRRPLVPIMSMDCAFGSESTGGSRAVISHRLYWAGREDMLCVARRYTAMKPS